MSEDIKNDWDELGEYFKKVRAIPMPEVKDCLCNDLLDDLEVALREIHIAVDRNTGKDIPF